MSVIFKRVCFGFGKEMKMEVKLNKVGEDFTVHRYENGYMVEVSNEDEEQNWKQKKVLCTNKTELFQFIERIMKTPLQD